METEFLKQIVLQGVRWLAGPVVAWLAVKSGLTQDQATAAIVGTVTAGLMFLWGMTQKWRKEKEIDTALELPSNSSRETLKDVIAKK